MKRHIRERLNPSRSEKTDSTRSDKRDGQERSNVPSRRENTWGRLPYPQQPRYFKQYPRFFFFFNGAHPTDPDTKIKLHFFRNRITGDQTLERKRTTTNQNFKITNRDGSYKTEEILKRRRVNLSDIQPTQSETDLLQKGLNFCPTPPPPTVDNINNLRLLTPLPPH